MVGHPGSDAEPLGDTSSLMVPGAGVVTDAPAVSTMAPTIPKLSNEKMLRPTAIVRRDARISLPSLWLPAGYWLRMWLVRDSHPRNGFRHIRTLLGTIDFTVTYVFSITSRGR